MKTGFAFEGKTYDQQIRNMVKVFDEALNVWENDKPTWKRIKANAKKMRFTWEDSVDAYYKDLYLL
jgi:starch synthase